LALPLLLALLSITVSSQVFKGHKIGETADDFFSIATVMGMPTSLYCKQLLSDPKSVAAYDQEKAQADDRAFSRKTSYLAADMEGCRQVQAALEGKDVSVHNTRTNGFDAGATSVFRGSRLVTLAFGLKPGTRFEDVVTDISKELGDAAPMRSVVMRQNGTFQERRANWDVNNLHAEAGEMRDSQHDDLGIAVAITDSQGGRTRSLLETYFGLKE
jgi:hypothetical protein